MKGIHAKNDINDFLKIISAINKFHFINSAKHFIFHPLKSDLENGGSLNHIHRRILFIYAKDYVFFGRYYLSSQYSYLSA